MIQDIYTSITQMEPNALRSCVRDLKKRNDSLSLEERIKLHFGLVQMDCLDSAMYQMQAIHKEITTAGISRDFLAAHPDLKVRLMATYNIWEDACGNIHVKKVDECCSCFEGDTACCCGPVCCAIVGYAACFGGRVPLDVACGYIDVCAEPLCSPCCSCIGSGCGCDC